MTPVLLLAPMRWIPRAYPALAASLSVLLLALMRTRADGGLVAFVLGLLAMAGLGLALGARDRPEGPGHPAPAPTSASSTTAHRRPWVRALVDQSEGRLLDRAFPLAVWIPGDGRASDGLDVVTDMLDLAGISTGDEVARVTVRDVHGREREYGLHANLATGDGSAFSRDLFDGRLPGLLVHAATYGLDGRAVAVPTPVSTFQRSWSFERSQDVEEVRVRFLAAGGRLRVHGFWLWKQRDRPVR